MNLFPTSVVGSLPRPAFVLDILANRDGLSSAEFEQRMQAAIGYAVVMQEQAGLDVLTDGEWRRKSYIGVISELANGFELGAFADGRPFTVVVDKLAAKAGGFVAREVSFLKDSTKRGIKSTLPSPLTSAAATEMGLASTLSEEESVKETCACSWQPRTSMRMNVRIGFIAPLVILQNQPFSKLITYYARLAIMRPKSRGAFLNRLMTAVFTTESI